MLFFDDCAGALMVAALEVSYAVTDASEKEKAAARAAAAACLAALGNAAAAGACVTAAASAADCVMDECGVDAKARGMFSACSSAASTICSGGASAASLANAGVQVGLYSAGEGLEAAGIEGASGKVLQTLSAGMSLNAGEALAKNAAGLVGGGVAAGVHAGSAGEDRDLFGALGSGYSTGAAVGGAVNGIVEGSSNHVSGAEGEQSVDASPGHDAAITSLARDKTLNQGWNDADLTLSEHEAHIREQIAEGTHPWAAKTAQGIVELGREAVGAAVTAAVHVRSQSRSSDASSFLDAVKAGQRFGRAAVSAGSTAMRGEAAAMVSSAVELAAASAAVYRQTEIQAKADRAREKATVMHSETARMEADRLDATIEGVKEATSEARVIQEALGSGKKAERRQQMTAWLEQRRGQGTA